MQTVRYWIFFTSFIILWHYSFSNSHFALRNIKLKIFKWLFRLKFVSFICIYLFMKVYFTFLLLLVDVAVYSFVCCLFFLLFNSSHNNSKILLYFFTFMVQCCIANRLHLFCPNHLMSFCIKILLRHN